MRIVFLDRDGVINAYPGDTKYVTKWEEFHFLPGVNGALKKLNDKDFKIFIISNQAGVSKGIYSQGDLNLITKNMLKELEGHNIQICGVYYCTHKDEDECLCRKPKTGLIDTAVADFESKGFKIDMDKSFFIGDTIRDIETGKKAGLSTILVFSGKEKPGNKKNWLSLPDITCRDLSEAVDLILKSGCPKE